MMLVLCLLAIFVLAGGEAWAAEQPSQTTQPGTVQDTMTINGKVAEPTTGVTPPVELPPVETETPSAEESSPPSNEETPPAEEPSPPPVEPAPSAPEPEPAPQPTPQPAPQWFAVVLTDGQIVESEPVVTSWTTPEPEQAPDVAYPAPGSEAPGGDSGTYVPSTSADDSWPTGSAVEEDAVPIDQGAPVPVVGSVAASDPVAPESATLLPESVRGLVPESVISRGTEPQPAPAVFEQAAAAATVTASVKGATRLPSSLGTTAATAVSSAVGTVRNAVASTAASVAAEVLGALTGVSPPSNSSTSGTQEQPSEGAPQPASAPPLAPPVGGGQFSLSMGSGGNVGPGGGFAPVLLGMLALAAILLKRDFRTYLVSCEMPKPSSALLLPLERPG